jgi:hypothetical protein
VQLFTGLKRPFLSAVVAAAVGLAAGVLIVIATGTDGAGSGGSEVERAEAPATTDPPTPAEVAAEVEVVETGFTTDDRLYCQNGADQDTSDGCEGCSISEGCAVRPPEAQHLVSYGLKVHNGGELLLEDIPLTVTLRDANGDPTLGSGGSVPTFEISRLLPGETLGLADVVDADRSGTAEVTADAGTADVATSVDYARSTADLPGLYEATAAAVHVTDVPVTPPGRRPGAQWTIAFRLEASVPDDLVAVGPGTSLDATVHAIYRDTHGRIIGGSSGDLVGISGRSSGSVVVDNLDVTFPDIDPSRTELYFTDFTVGRG